MSTLGAQLSIKGERRTGQDVRTQNVMAASSIANIVKVRIACEYHPNIFLRIFIKKNDSLFKLRSHLKPNQCSARNGKTTWTNKM